MKTLTQILLVSFLFISSKPFASTAAAVEKVDPSKHKSFFVLKTEKQLVGAQLEVYSSSGELITSQSLQKRKVVIDFSDVKFGTYTVRITKGETLQEFKYIKNN